MASRFKLTIELVPETAWHSSLYRYYKDRGQLEKWRKLKEDLFKKEGRKCWICGKEGTRLEAHEFWEYDDVNHVQRLVAIHHLCSLCHKIKHIGFWCYTDRGSAQLELEGLTREDLIEHFCEVNNCTKDEFEEHEKEVFETWSKRSSHEWKQDLGPYEVRKHESRLPLL